MVECVYRVVWYEYERGYGRREFAITHYPTLEAANKAIEEHWAQEQLDNPSGKTPECYVAPSEPKLFEKGKLPPL